jgi:hypothetical protein
VAPALLTKSGESRLERWIADLRRNGRRAAAAFRKRF